VHDDVSPGNTVLLLDRTYAIGEYPELITIDLTNTL